ncbi:hypothetical protein AMTRI_Chr05g70480 [Amborella trichopoda]
MCKGTQVFVHRSCLNYWRSVKAIPPFMRHIIKFKTNLNLMLYTRRTSSLCWRKIKLKIFVAQDDLLVFLAIQTPGVFVFFVILGIGGLLVHCSSINNNDPCIAGCRNCCYGWGILDCFPFSMEACRVLLVIFVVIFSILGIACVLLAVTMAIQRICRNITTFSPRGSSQRGAKHLQNWTMNMNNS